MNAARRYSPTRASAVRNSTACATAVMDFLIAERVDTVFMSIHGRYRGRLMHEHSKNVRLRLAQYQRLQDAAMSLTLAKCLVRGCEGRASAVYFGTFGQLLKHPDFQFTDRNRRPPLDPVNVLLSLGYTLLANAVETAVQIVGLDPYLGALHDVAYGRPSLVCDLMEEYRSVIVEPMVVACINQRSFSLDDFEAGADGEPVRFQRTAMKWFIELFERRLRGEILYPPRGQRLTYRQVIEEQVRHCARVLLGTQETYEPFLIR